MQYLFPWNRVLTFHILTKRNAGNEFHNKVADILSLADIINSYNTRMGKLCNGMCFGKKPGADFFITEEFVTNNFDCYFSVEACIHSAVDNSHATLTDFFKDLIPVIQHNAKIFCIRPFTHDFTTSAIVTLSPAPRA